MARTSDSTKVLSKRDAVNERHHEIDNKVTTITTLLKVTTLCGLRYCVLCIENTIRIVNNRNYALLYSRYVYDFCTHLNHTSTCALLKVRCY